MQVHDSTSPPQLIIALHLFLHMTDLGKPQQVIIPPRYATSLCIAMHSSQPEALVHPSADQHIPASQLTAVCVVACMQLVQVREPRKGSIGMERYVESQLHDAVCCHPLKRYLKAASQPSGIANTTAHV
jgi:hypothetical protein